MLNIPLLIVLLFLNVVCVGRGTIELGRHRINALEGKVTFPEKEVTGGSILHASVQYSPATSEAHAWITGGWTVLHRGLKH